MYCPHCQDLHSKVTDSRDATGGVRRRRECLKCNTRFTTYERVQSASILVLKRDGRREELNREKLLTGVRLACAKRPLPIGALEKLVDDIEADLQQIGRAEVPSQTIGEMVVQRLKQLDRVAYIRFSSIYKDFADIESFKDEIEDLLSAREVRNVPHEQLALLPPDIPYPQPTRRRGYRSSQVTQVASGA